MTDTPDGPRVLSPRDEARVLFAYEVEHLRRKALALLPVDPAAPRGERLRRTLALKQMVDELVEHAVVAEREEGTTWSQVAAAAGISKQAAHERWTGGVNAWAASGRSLFSRDSHHSTLDAAQQLDRVYADHDPEHPQHAVSSGLDAVRFPGTAAAEAARRERATGLHARLAVLSKQITPAYDEWSRLNDVGARPEARAEVLTRLAVLHEESAALYEELTGAEPELADEHRDSAEQARRNSGSRREHAELLADAARTGAASAGAAQGDGDRT
ncbi:hypothetical protein [Streptomyces sp. SID8374]|uniref:hypothetical protein n=1 Tax=Streptomyces sp. SID8374 TaxID=2690354 RepID=UPI0019259275|nr:hypothetical protein [Streptomyces sp. SID8374]